MYRASTFATSTCKTYRSHLKSYLGFCMKMNYRPVPVEPAVLCRYIGFLARNLRYNSIKQYLNIITIIHKECGYAFQLSESWLSQSLLRGIKREKGNEVTKKLPLTPQHLLLIRSCLNLESPSDANFWAACLVGFFGFLRRANLLPQSAAAHKPTVNLSRVHFSPHSWGLAVKIVHSKTNQFKEREIIIALPSLPGHQLCPVSAILRAFALTPTVPALGPAFWHVQAAGLQPLTKSQFARKLSTTLVELGFPADKYSGHSLRRGGASWALACGIPAEIIQLMGDWKSSCFMGYFHCPLSSRLNYAQQFALCLPNYQATN